MNPFTQNIEMSKEALSTDAWRVFRIISEFVEGFEKMVDLGPSVSIFGSARLPETHPVYQQAVALAEKIVQKGFAVITGGGPGIMEAANRGAQLGKGRSCGLAIDLPWESQPNAFIDQRYLLSFRYFFIRKVMFIRYAQGFVFLPGGYGTLDELFEALTLIQTKKVHNFPIFLLGKSYWAGLIDWIKETMIKEQCILEEDLSLFVVTDDPDEIVNGIEKHYREQHVLRNF